MIQNYKDFKNYQFENDGQIPKIIFRTGRYTIDQLPTEIKNLYEKEMSENLDFTLFYFDDEDCKEFILNEYDQSIYDYYDKLIPTAFKADLWRYLILYKYGGTYIDFSMHPLMPYSEIVKYYRRQIYVRDTCDIGGIYNAFIATVPHTEILRLTIDKAIDNIRRKNKGIGALDVTGPTMIGRIIKEQLDVFFYDWIPIGNVKKDLYIYTNPSNEYIEDEFGTKIIKNRLDNHYELTYNEKPHPLIINTAGGMLPMNHYSRLWSDDKIYKD